MFSSGELGTLILVSKICVIWDPLVASAKEGYSKKLLGWFIEQGATGRQDGHWALVTASGMGTSPGLFCVSCIEQHSPGDKCEVSNFIGSVTGVRWTQFSWLQGPKSQGKKLWPHLGDVFVAASRNSDQGRSGHFLEKG